MMTLYISMYEDENDKCIIATDIKLFDTDKEIKVPVDAVEKVGTFLNADEFVTEYIVEVV